MSARISKTYLLSVYLFLYFPILIIAVFSFNSAQHSLLWHHFSWKSYHALFNDADLGRVTLHSLVLGLVSAFSGTVLGCSAAISFFRYRFLGGRFYYLILFLLIVLPDILLAIIFLLVFHALHFPLGFWSLLLSHTTFILPFSFMGIYTQLRQLDENLLSAAQDLGASAWQLYRRVLLPLIMPSLIVSVLLGFTLSFDDIMISYFVSGPDFQILPLQIYSMVRLGAGGELDALSTLLLLMTALLTFFGRFLWNKKK